MPVVGGVIGEPMSWLIKPETPIKFYATKIHGLTNNDVAECPMFEDIRGQVLHALNAPAIVAHNAHVDVGVLQRKLGEWQCPEVFDTLKLARRLVPGLSSYKLGSLVEAFKLAEGLPDGLSPHRATYDALVAARLFVLLATKAATLEELRGQQPEGGDDEAPALF